MFIDIYTMWIVWSKYYDDLGAFLDIGLAVHAKTTDRLQEIFSKVGRQHEINLWESGGGLKPRIFVKNCELFAQDSDKAAIKLANSKEFLAFALDAARSKFDRPDLTGADFTQLNADGVDFSNCILDSADFKESKFDKAKFVDASLVSAVFSSKDGYGTQRLRKVVREKTYLKKPIMKVPRQVSKTLTLRGRT